MSESPYTWKTDLSGVGQGTVLLQVRDNCGYDVAPDKVMLWPMAFASKSLSSVEW